MQVYRQVILSMICYFMQEPLDLNTFYLDDAKSKEQDLSTIIANQINYSSSTRDLNYAKPNFIFLNVKTSV